MNKQLEVTRDILRRCDFWLFFYCIGNFDESPYAIKTVEKK